VLARSTYQRYGHAIRNGLRVLIGATVGLSLALAAQRIAGADPPVVAFLVAVLLGGLVPIAVDALLPDVDVALLGRTRIVVVARRLAASAGSALGAQVLAFLAGK
jgi:hypothetical protein